MRTLILLISALAIISCSKGSSTTQPSKPYSVFKATLSPQNVVPQPCQGATGSGSATAILQEDVLILSGSFSGLHDTLFTGLLGGINIHKGSKTEVGYFIFTPDVHLNDDKKSGRFSGIFQLTPTRINQLKNDSFYIDIHTPSCPNGEIRGQLELQQ